MVKIIYVWDMLNKQNLSIPIFHEAIMHIIIIEMTMISDSKCFVNVKVTTQVCPYVTMFVGLSGPLSIDYLIL